MTQGRILSPTFDKTNANSWEFCFDTVVILRGIYILTKLQKKKDFLDPLDRNPPPPLIIVNSGKFISCLFSIYRTIYNLRGVHENLLFSNIY